MMDQMNNNLLTPMVLEQYTSLLANQKSEPDWRNALKQTHALVREALADRELIPSPAEIINQAREEQHRW